jgi:hypothetical protein
MAKKKKTGKDVLPSHRDMMEVTNPLDRDSELSQRLSCPDDFDDSPKEKSGSSSRLSVPSILASVAILIAVCTYALAPTSDDFVNKADYDTLKATVEAMQSQSTDIAVLETRLASDLASVRSDVTAVWSDMTVMQSDVTAVQSDVTAVQSDVAAVQTTVAGLPTSADVTAAVAPLAVTSDVTVLQTALQTQIDALDPDPNGVHYNARSSVDAMNAYYIVLAYRAHASGGIKH